jgi:hypothetical protein
VVVTPTLRWQISPILHLLHDSYQLNPKRRSCVRQSCSDQLQSKPANMPEPVSTIAGFVASGINACIRLAEFGLHFADVSNETRQFLINIQLVDQKINTARRLRRVKSGYLDSHTKADVDNDIDTAERVLKLIGESIEKCRVDLDVSESVRAHTRLKWLMKDYQSFCSKERTLSNSLQALICSINQMSLIKPPEDPPSYEVASQFTKGLVRGPTQRRKMAKETVRELMEEESGELEENGPRFDRAPSRDYNVTELDADREPADWQYLRVDVDPEPKARRIRSSAIR